MDLTVNVKDLQAGDEIIVRDREVVVTSVGFVPLDLNNPRSNRDLFRVYFTGQNHYGTEVRSFKDFSVDHNFTVRRSA